MLGRAVHIGPQIEHRGGAALGIGHLGGNGRAVNAIERLEDIAGNGHQGTRVAGGNRGSSRAILYLLNGNAHGRILLAAQGNLHGVIHGNHLGGQHDGSALVRERLKTVLQTDQQQMGIGMIVEELAARRERDAGAVVAPHAVNSQCDHGRLVRPAVRAER